MLFLIRVTLQLSNPVLIPNTLAQFWPKEWTRLAVPDQSHRTQESG